MKSVEISKKIGQLEAEKAKLEEELFDALKVEEEERKKNLLDNSRAFIYKLWELYWKGEDNTEAQEKLDKCLTEYREPQLALNLWIEADVKAALKKTELDASEEIKKLITEYSVECNFDKCIEDAEVRLDFASYLRNVNNTSELAHKLSYGFDSDDLMELMKLHKGNKFRKKIENLLTGCNYHSESALLSEKKYDEFEKFVMEDCQ
jgi:hypothetical protein